MISKSTFSKAKSQVENVVFSMQRAAVEKPLNPKTNDVEFVLNMSWSYFFWLGDKTVVRRAKDESWKNVSSSNWNMVYLVWNEEQVIPVWSSFCVFQTRKQVGLVVDSCLKKQGYSKRYQIRINNFRDPPEYMVLDIHKWIRNKKQRYLLL